jgi:hypothetical protein
MHTHTHTHTHTDLSSAAHTAVQVTSTSETAYVYQNHATHVHYGVPEASLYNTVLCISSRKRFWGGVYVYVGQLGAAGERRMRNRGKMFLSCAGSARKIYVFMYVCVCTYVFVCVLCMCMYIYTCVFGYTFILIHYSYRHDSYTHIWIPIHTNTSLIDTSHTGTIHTTYTQAFLHAQSVYERLRHS